jgi:hypothetical protein
VRGEVIDPKSIQGLGETLNLKTLQVIPDAVMPGALCVSGKAAFGEQSKSLTIGEFDPGSG